MISMTRTLLAGAAFAIVAGSAAQAADLRVPPLSGGMKDYGGAVAVPAPMPIREYANWYLRGDIGYAFADFEGAYTSDAYIGGLKHHLEGGDMDDAFVIGGGVGYYFNQHLRGDLTVDHKFSRNITGTISDKHSYSDAETIAGAAGAVVYHPVDIEPANAVADGTPISGIYHQQGDQALKTHVYGDYDLEVNTTVFMANMYYDFRSRQGFTPYIGAGIGFAVHDINKGNINFSCPAGCGSIDQGLDEDTETTFAASAMAGFSYMMRTGWHFDMGYKFSWLGNVTTRASRTFDDPTLPDSASAPTTVGSDGTLDTTTVTFETEDLFDHEIRIGFRMDLH